ncbi:hypothetical protein WIS52_20150 [Pseudonocardia nematodicida]|uniref:Uncharacterized protein n=1 Tax=Pseudonocardia nematodicida TaxID=1206997 RepID=A0ABV1KF42_9PSEU
MSVLSGVFHFPGSLDHPSLVGSFPEASPLGTTLWTSRRSVLYSVGEPVSGDRVHRAVLEVDGSSTAAVVLGRIHDGSVSDLRALGFGAACRNSAEVAISAYTAWGEGFVGRLGEECSVILWDEGAARLVLANGTASPDLLRFRRVRDRVHVHNVLRPTRTGGARGAAAWEVAQHEATFDSVCAGGRTTLHAA